MPFKKMHHRSLVILACRESFFIQKDSGRAGMTKKLTDGRSGKMPDLFSFDVILNLFEKDTICSVRQ
jgi:hypothetical protein